MVLISLIVLFITGCSSYFATNGEQRYLMSNNGPGIKTVPPLTDANVSHFYDLPQQTHIAKINILPPSIDLNIEKNKETSR